MALPDFLGPAIPLKLAAAAFAGAAAGGAAAASQKLAFSIQPQTQSNWCWAAVSTSVSHFYTTSSTWTQCTVANAALPRTDCCSAPGNCNQPWYLDVALQTTGNFKNMVSSSLAFADIQNEIGNDGPIGARVAWYGGGAHFMVVAGWLVGDTGTEYIDISDPIYLDSQIAYADFASSYQSGGDWTHSYFTQLPQLPQMQAWTGGLPVVTAMAVTPTVRYPEAIGA